MSESSFLGRWSASGRAIEIARRDDKLLLLAPGAPEEFAPALVADTDGRFLISGGSYGGLSVHVGERNGAPHLVIGDVITLPAWDESSGTPSVVGVPAPPMQLDLATERRYSELLEEVRAADGGVVVPHGIALDAWIRWLTDQDVVLFHGSASGEIDELIPRRTSYEVNDEAGRGNLPAVYATHDGWWSLWFAIVERDGLRGTIRSGFEWVDRPDGSRLSVYFFSVDQHELPRAPWHNGWLYILPRETFQRLPIVPGGPPSIEWASTEAVRPLARLAVTPADFPFLEHVCGHDDGELLRHEELSTVVRQHVTAATRGRYGVVLELNWDDELAGVVGEYVELSGRIMPEISGRVDQVARRLYLDTSPALAEMILNTYGDKRRD